MKSLSNIQTTTLKSTLLAAPLFWISIFIEEGLYVEMLPFLLLSIIPTFIICLLAIVFTITPIWWFNKNNLNYNEFFKRYFPFYSIILFGVCSYFIIISNFKGIAVGFLFTVFFTAIQTWVWIFKPEKNDI